MHSALSESDVHPVALQGGSGEASLMSCERQRVTDSTKTCGSQHESVHLTMAHCSPYELSIDGGKRWAPPIG